MDFPIKIKDFDTLFKFNDLACQAAFDMRVEFDNNIINAKSSIGLVLALNKQAKLVVPDDADMEFLNRILAVVLT